MSESNTNQPRSNSTTNEKLPPTKKWKKHVDFGQEAYLSLAGLPDLGQLILISLFKKFKKIQIKKWGCQHKHKYPPKIMFIEIRNNAELEKFI